MKNKVFIIICLVLLIFGMTACQRDESGVESPQPQENNTLVPTESESEPVTEDNQEQATEVEFGYPVEETTPTKAESQSEIESAYPVTQEDLQMLYHTWSLTNYFVDEISQEAGIKTIKFNADGTYEMTTDEGSQTGQWRTRLMASESTLILEPDEGIKTTYEIVDITQAVLNLRMFQDNMQIDEQYLPAD